MNEGGSSPRRPDGRWSDWRGGLQLAAQATRGVAAVVEGVHASVWRSLGADAGLPAGRTRGLTGLVYRSIESISRVIEHGGDLALALLHARDQGGQEVEVDTPKALALRAILNGVLGDHLDATGNPLAIPMHLHHAGVILDPGSEAIRSIARRHLLLFVHGLCMNDQQWCGEYQGQRVDHAAALADQLGATPLHLRYNSGLAIAQNGRALSEQLEHLIETWPLPIESIRIVGHSMGGLVARSACDHGERRAARWRTRVRDLSFLGVPHHGAPLERAGHWVDHMLAAGQYTAPFAKLAQIRSAGITDLRHGRVRDLDALDEAHGGHADSASRLPDGVACYSIAATLAVQAGRRAQDLIGDGLVPLNSALGEHIDPARDLGLNQRPHRVITRCGHIELLYRPEVWEQLQQWLRGDPA